MRHSFRRQLTTIFTTVMAGTLLLIFFSGVLFLEKYYISDKQKHVISAYEKLNTAALEGTMEAENFQENLQSLSTTDNISFIIMDTDARIKFFSSRNSEEMKFQLWDYIFGRESFEMTKILEETPFYVLRQSRERISGMEYLEMIGTLENGDYFIMKTPLESIRDSVILANRFYTIIGTIVIFISAVIIYLFSRK